MRRFGLVLVALAVVACGGDGATPDKSVAGTSAPTRALSEAALLPNTQWLIASIDGQPSSADPPTKIFFGLSNAFNGLQVSGLCKTLFGTYRFDGAALTPALELGEATECDADAAAARQSIMEAINGSTAWSVVGDTLTLTGAKTIVLDRP